MNTEPSFGVFHIVATLAGLLVAWPVSTGADVPAGGPIAGVGAGLAAWALMTRLDRAWVVTRRLHLVGGGGAVVTGVAVLAARRLDALGSVGGFPWYPLAVSVCGLLLVSHGIDSLARNRRRDGTVRDRISVTVPRGHRMVRGIVLAGIGGVGVRLLVGDPVGWIGVLAGTVPGVLISSRGGDAELVALDCGLIIVTDDTSRFVPWDAIGPPVRDGSSIRLTHVRPYPGVYRRVAADEDDARSFVDTIRRHRRR